MKPSVWWDPTGRRWICMWWPIQRDGLPYAWACTSWAQAMSCANAIAQLLARAGARQ